MKFDNVNVSALKGILNGTRRVNSSNQAALRPVTIQKNEGSARLQKMVLAGAGVLQLTTLLTGCISKQATPTDDASVVMEQTDEVTGQYQAPDGTYWNSEEDYQDYLNGSAELTEQVEQDEDDLLDFLSTFEDVDGGMSDNQKTEGEVLSGDEHVTYTDNTYTDPETGTHWVSEEDYQQAKDAGIVNQTNESTVVSTDTNAWQAPDGSYWQSEEEYQEYVNSQNQNETVVSTDTNAWQAPDGSYWSSEEEYNKYNASSNTVVSSDGIVPGPGVPSVTAYGPGEEVSETEENFQAPDGSYWSSEADYEAYMNSFNTFVEEYDSSDVYSDDMNQYQAPDGSYWESEEAYQDFINDFSSLTDEYDASHEEYVSGEDTDDYFVAPDGSYWVSEEEYQDFLNSEVNSISTAPEGITETFGDIVEVSTLSSNPVEQEENIEEEITPAYEDSEETIAEDTDDYFVAPDGSYWVSEEEYQESLNSGVDSISAAPEETTEVFSGVEEAADFSSDSIESEEMTQEEVAPTYENSEEVSMEDNEWFQAPDGTYWVSEEDYLEFMEMQNGKSL